jgi:hypothetical protein
VGDQPGGHADPRRDGAQRHRIQPVGEGEFARSARDLIAPLIGAHPRPSGS